LGDGEESERVEKAYEPIRELVASMHLHDNHGEKDEHLPPFEGSIDWENAIPLLKASPEKNLAITLELKEKTGSDAPAMSEQLAAARIALDRFEKAWSQN